MSKSLEELRGRYKERYIEYVVARAEYLTTPRGGVEGRVLETCEKALDAAADLYKAKLEEDK